MSNGTLPGGLTLGESTGVISGAPIAAGTSTVTIRVEDSATSPQSDQQSFSLTISQVILPPPPLQITTTSPLPTGAVGVPYTLPITATGGTGARTWTVINGTLPVELRLDSNTGVISGTPTTAGTSTVTIRVQDSAAPPQSNQKVFDLTIMPSPCSNNCPQGTLEVLNAPASVGDTFTGTVSVQTGEEVNWKESSGNHVESLSFHLHNLPGLTYQLVFTFSDLSAGSPGFGVWTCTFPGLPTFGTCNGVALNQAGGTLTLTNTMLPSADDTNQSITLNGTLRFTPF